MGMIYSCVKECKGCMFVWGGSEEIGDNVCSRYARPFAKWNKLGGCEGATHVVRTAPAVETKKRVGQQKQRKEKK